jgi:hypothetical protein
MEHVWRKIGELREQFEVLREDRTPIDVFAFLELDLGLDPIPFDDLPAKYRVEAAIKADFTGIYLDAEQYKLMEKPSSLPRSATASRKLRKPSIGSNSWWTAAA